MYIHLVIAFYILPLAILFPNNIMEEPCFSCSIDAIYAKWKMQHTFKGRVNVRYTIRT
jgi:hypothetical protein